MTVSGSHVECDFLGISFQVYTAFSEDTVGPIMTVDWTCIMAVRSPLSVDSISTMVVVSGNNFASRGSIAVVAMSNLMMARVRTVVMVVMRGSSSLIVRARSIG